MSGFCSFAHDVASRPTPEEGHAVGRTRGDELRLELRAEISDLYQLVKVRKIAVTGLVWCRLIDDQPLRITEGHWQVRPAAGVNAGAGGQAIFLRYDCRLVAADGRGFALRGVKRNLLRWDVWRQVTTLDVELEEMVAPGGRPRTIVVGRVGIALEDFAADQVGRLTADPQLAPLQQKYAQVAWFAFLGANIGKNYFDLAARALRKK